ncbi:hypothetical protein B0H67DRAFT_556087 [Lasiosphaeris hirsuta]|uniref:AAA+ ATPase domain-containing protein n=1 Tax=Lasiosphaeris hirsuta TaxID=260670 RepID=A0AA40A180_9PEZI|nr:hypothetical protein B0H67DRAFT_556087 [Lasiosphaeris hirsuta]
MDPQESPLSEYDRILGASFTSLNPKESAKDETPKVESSDRPKPVTWKPELKKVVQYVEEGREVVLGFENFKPTRPARKQEVPREVPADGPFSDSAMLLKALVKHSTPRGPTFDLRLEIQSKALRDLFRLHAKHYQELNLNANPIVVDYPFRSLFFLRGRLQILAKDVDTPKETKQELIPLLDFIEEPLGVQRHIEEYDDLVLRQHKVTFRMLWSLFPPYSPVLAADEGGCKLGMAYLVESISLSGGRWDLVLLHGHHNGSGFQIRRTTRSIPYFNGQRDINRLQLPIVPLHLARENEQNVIYDALVERGKRYVKYCAADTSFLRYQGRATLRSSENDARLGAWDSTGVLEIDERVVLDRTAQYRIAGFSDESGDYVAASLGAYFASILGEDRSSIGTEDLLDNLVTVEDLKLGNATPEEKEQAGKSSSSARPKEIVPNKVFRAAELTDEDYLICQCSTIAFALDQKAWVRNVRISQLEEIEWHGDPFSSLQFTDKAKMLVRQLVKGFTNRRENVYDDIIKGKGKGLIFLLHGPPGLGKTLTAESVAESAKLPLYRVTTGELSTDARQLESQLGDIFRLGARWKAVVLLDEADVLMSRRNVNDLHRNAIVAVFLRLLEYYRGMLFLTTNRLDDFDEAFYSRIHVTLEYGALTRPWRTNIWREHVGLATARSTARGLWTDDVFAALGEIDTNGRDIKNYTRTAYAFAQATDEDLALEHLLVVLTNNLSKARRENTSNRSAFRKLEWLERELGARKSSDGGTPQGEEVKRLETVPAVEAREEEERVVPNRLRDLRRGGGGSVEMVRRSSIGW